MTDTWAPIDLVPDASQPAYKDTTGYKAPHPPLYRADTAAWGLRLAPGRIALDVDHHDGKHGRDTIAKLEAELGPLPPTVKVTSRGFDELGGKYLYRVPAGGAWRDVGGDVEVLHFGWRYIQMGMHRKTSSPVTCYAPGGQEIDWRDVDPYVTELPAPWVEYARTGDRETVPGNADLPADDGRCPVALAHVEAQDFSGASARGARANKVVSYLKRMHAEGHQVGGVIDDVVKLLPNTSDDDFTDMWDQPVPARIVWRERDCAGGRCLEEPVAISPVQPAAMNGVGQVDLLARMKTGRYLNTATFSPLHYHIEGLVPEGLTVLAGAPKVGKSWLVLEWLLDLASAGHAVLYFALEDSDRRMQFRCRKLLRGVPVPDTFAYLTEEDIIPGSLLPTVAQFVAQNHDRTPLIVVDTLAKAMQATPRVSDEPAYERDYRVTSTLQGLVKGCPGAGLVLCHHDRKAGGEDWIDKISGTKGLTGGPDALILLERKRDESDGTLRVTGRDIAENDYAMVYLDGHRWAYFGGALETARTGYITRKAQAGLGDRSAEIIALANEKPEGITRSDVAEELGITPEAATTYLTRLRSAGRLLKPKTGLYTPVMSVMSTPPSTGESNSHNRHHTTPRVGEDSPAGGDPTPHNRHNSITVGESPLSSPGDLTPDQVARLDALICTDCDHLAGVKCDRHRDTMKEKAS